jgi:hypothetical protein
MMLLQAGQLGLYSNDSIWTGEIPPDMVSGATMWIDFTDTLTLYAGGHLDGGNVTTTGTAVMSVDSKVSPGYGVYSEGANAGEFRTPATPSGKGAVAFNNQKSRYTYYDMRSAGYIGVALSTLVSTTAKVVIAAVKVAGSTPFNGSDMNGGDVIFGDNDNFALFVTEDSGVISARASNYVAFPDNSVEQAISRDTWVVLTVSHQSGSLRLRANGGTWVTASSGTTNFGGDLPPQILNNPNSGAGSEIAIAHIATFKTAQTDAAISAVEHWMALDVGITPWW